MGQKVKAVPITDHTLPRQVIFSNIGAGAAHTVAFTAAGTMWLWGSLQSPNTTDQRDEKESDRTNEDSLVNDTLDL